jgi:hypothetical protein
MSCDLRSRFDQGLIAPNEVLIAEAQQSRQRVLAIEATNLRGVSEADLRRLIGLDTADRIEPVAVLDSAPGPVAAPRGWSVKPGRKEQNAVLGGSTHPERAKTPWWLRTAAVGVTGGYDYMRPNPHIFPRAEKWQDSWDASVNVSWLLWDGGRRRARSRRRPCRVARGPVEGRRVRSPGDLRSSAEASGTGVQPCGD